MTPQEKSYTDGLVSHWIPKLTRLETDIEKQSPRMLRWLEAPNLTIQLCNYFDYEDFHPRLFQLEEVSIEIRIREGPDCFEFLKKMAQNENLKLFSIQINSETTLQGLAFCI